MDRYLVCIGSNTDRDVNMDSCRQLLLSLYADVEFSEMIETAPFGDGYKGNFFNQLIILKTNESIEKVVNNLDWIEKKLGRLPNDKRNGIVKIDIDVLAQNNKIVKHEDFNRPYMSLLLQKVDYVIDYNKRG